MSCQPVSALCDRPRSVEISRMSFRTKTWFAVVASALLATWVGIGIVLWQRGVLGDGPVDGAPAVPQENDGPRPSKPPAPPWGKIERIPITIAPPIEFLPEYTPLEKFELVWYFPTVSASRLNELLAEAGISEEVRRKLASLAVMEPSISGYAIRPSEEFVLSLSAEDRAKLYVLLAQFMENFYHVKAFRYCGKSLDEWFRGAQLAPETIALVSPLVFQHEGYLFFADLRLIEKKIASPDERLALLKALSREATFLVRVRVDQNSDIEDLVNYWGRGGRAKDVRPLLESAASVPGGVSLAISHLLPPFARQRLYTYPVPPERAPAINQDCHWTAFNFFNTEPDDRFSDENEVVKALDNDYYRVFGNLQLGDIVMFFIEGNRAIHSAVYIAEDILFTKNGSIASRPWMLTTLEDMKGYYPTLKPKEIRYYRKKNI